MPVEGNYLGMPLRIEDFDGENLAYFRYCAEHDYRLQKCTACGLIRYPPTTACPWCARPESEWVSVEGKGAVHSYGEILHAIQPAFKEHLPYLVLLVDLDTQLGRPTEHEALRIIGNLVVPDGELAPADEVARVGIDSRVRMVFNDVAEGLAVPNWTFDRDAEQPERPWRYPD